MTGQRLLEGFRFVGYQIYEPPDRVGISPAATGLRPLVPGLAESWEAAQATQPTKWVFKLRRGVDVPLTPQPIQCRRGRLSRSSRSRRSDAPHFDTYGSGRLSFRPRLDHRDHKESTTTPWSSRPTSPPASCPTSSATCSSCRRPSGRRFTDWRKFAEQPSGTGPYKVTQVRAARAARARGQQAVLGRQAPAQDRQARAACPCREPTTRLAAPRSGQVDWIEVPPPDSIPQLKGARLSPITLNSYPHNWTHTLRLDKEAVEQQARPQGGQLRDRPRRHLQEPAQRHLHSGHRRRVQRAIRGSASRRRRTTTTRPRPRSCCKPGRASTRRKHPAKAVQLISTSGSGQMLPLAMNEPIQKNLKDVGIDVDLQPVEVEHRCSPAGAPASTRRTTRGSTPGTSRGTSSEPWSGFGRVLPQQVGGAGRRSTRCPTSIPRPTSSSTRPERHLRRRPSRTRSPGQAHARLWWTTPRGSSCVARPEPACAVPEGEGLRAARRAGSWT